MYYIKVWKCVQYFMHFIVFVEWIIIIIIKKMNRIKEHYILHFTNSECVLFRTAECLVYMCSLFMGMPLKPYFCPDYRNWCQYNFCHLPHVTISTEAKRTEILFHQQTFPSPNKLPPFHLFLGYHLNIRQSRFPDVCSSGISPSKNVTSHFYVLAECYCHTLHASSLFPVNVAWIYQIKTKC